MGPSPPSGGLGEGGSKENPESKAEPPSRGSEALRDGAKAWPPVNRAELQDHSGALTSAPWSPHREQGLDSSRLRRPQLEGEEQEDKKGSTNPQDSEKGSQTRFPTAPGP